MANKATHSWATVDLSGKDAKGKSQGASLTLVVNGITIPIAQFSMTYSVNDIPTATAILALGRDARTQQPSKAYDLLKTEIYMAPAYVELTGSLGDWSTDGSDGMRIQFPTAKNVTLFTGYLGNIAYTRSGGKVSLTVNLVNQLVLLSMTTGGTNHIIPGTPQDLLLPTMSQGTGIRANVADMSSMFTETLPQTLGSDFSKAILDVFKELASDKYNIQSHNPNFQPASGTSNNAAAKALVANGRWLGIHNLVTSSKLAKYVKPYPLPTNGMLIPTNIADWISKTLNSSIYSTDLWGTLIYSILPEFGCALIPLANTAVVAPILPMCNKAAISLKASDYVDFNMTANAKQPVRAVGIVYKEAMTTLFGVDFAGINIGGSYIASEDVSLGGWFFKQAPDWAAQLLVDDPNDKNPAIIETMTKPTTNANDNAPAQTPRDLASSVVDVNEMLGKYAKLVYLGIALKGRQGSLVSKLRFDICPGSTIKFELQPESITGAIDLLGAADSSGDNAFFYGFVNQVNIAFNAEEGFASTSFILTNLRSKPENDKVGRYSIEEHPFFGGNFFKGAPLIPELTPEVKIK